MFNKIVQHIKQKRFIGDFFMSSCIEIQNNTSIDAGGPSQQATNMWSRRLGQTFLKYYPCFFKDSNGCTLINASPLTKHNQEVFLSCIIDMCFVLFHSGSLPPITNPAFVFGLSHPNYVLGVNFCNKFVQPIECTPEIESFFSIISAY